MKVSCRLSWCSCVIWLCGWCVVGFIWSVSVVVLLVCVVWVKFSWKLIVVCCRSGLNSCRSGLRRLKCSVFRCVVFVCVVNCCVWCWWGILMLVN